MTRYPKGGYRRRATSRWILPVGVLLFTLALRLVWVSDAGYVADVDFFVPWMRLAAQGGIRHVLAVAKTSYPPLSVYLLWILGLFSRSGTLDGSAASVELLALRVAIVFFDVLMVAVLYRLGRHVAGRTIATWAALMYALCPGSIYLSGWWIQTDAWFVLPMLLGAWWLSQRRVSMAWMALGLAISLKLQAVVVLPIFAVGTWRWWGLRRLMIGGLVLAAIAAVLVAPLLATGQATDLLSKTTTQARHSIQWITLTSHNLWYALTPHARAVGHAGNRDQNGWIAGVSFHDAGLTLLALCYSLLLARLFIRSGPHTVFACCAVAWLAVFMLATRSHARYILPSLALMLCAGFYERHWWVLYGVASTTLLVNLVLKSSDISPLAGALPVTPEQAVVNAWVNVAVLGLALMLYVIPLLGPARDQAKLEGTLCIMERGWETTLLGVAGIAMLGTLGAVLWRGRTIGTQIAHLEPPLRASLDASLDGTDVPERAVVVNWPGTILAGRSAYLLGIIPVTPPALFLTTPDIVERGPTWVQYPPWQQARGLEIEYYGTHVTQAELTALVRQAERVLVFSPQTRQTHILAQEYPTVTVPDGCLAVFDDGVCLAEAQASWQGHTLLLNLTWQETNTLVDTNKTAFVHIVDENENLISQVDGDPARGLIPLASWDNPASALRETRLVAVPPGEYRVRIGIYDRTNGQRLKVRCSHTNACVGDAVDIAPLGSGPQQ